MLASSWTTYGGGFLEDQQKKLIGESEEYVMAASVWNLMLNRGAKANAQSRRSLVHEKKKELRDDDLVLNSKLAEHLDNFIRDGPLI